MITAEERAADLERVRLHAYRVALPIFQRTQGRPRIDRLLILGANCPFGSKQDKEVWCEEIDRLEGLEKAERV